MKTRPQPAAAMGGRLGDQVASIASKLSHNGSAGHTISTHRKSTVGASLLAMTDKHSTLISTDTPRSSDRRPEQAHSPRCRQCLVISKLPETIRPHQDISPTSSSEPALCTAGWLILIVKPSSKRRPGLASLNFLRPSTLNRITRLNRK